MKKFVSLLLVLVLALSISVVAYADTPNAVNKARDGIGFLYQEVQLKDADGNLMDKAASVGTGFFVGKKNENPQYFVTCYHCVEWYAELGKGTELSDGSSAVKSGLYIYFDKNDYVEAYLEAYDETKDIALLRINQPTTKRKAMPLVEPADNMVGKQVYALGYPASADITDPVDYWGKNSISITNGLLSRMVEESGTGVRKLQIDAKVSGGNSGCPLINAKGQVMGVVAHIISGENYAISTTEVIDMCKKQNLDVWVVPPVNTTLIILIAAGALLVIGLIVLIIVLTSSKGKKGGKGGRMIVGQAGALAGKTFVLKRGQKLLVGRNPDCQVRFPADTQGVSKVHCSITFDGEKVYVRDEGSSMGTYIGDTKVEAQKTITLHRGQMLYIGSKAQILVLRSK